MKEKLYTLPETEKTGLNLNSKGVILAESSQKLALCLATFFGTLSAMNLQSLYADLNTAVH